MMLLRSSIKYTFITELYSYLDRYLQIYYYNILIPFETLEISQINYANIPRSAASEIIQRHMPESEYYHLFPINRSASF